jgi:putative heme-binding domain-containing protein
MVGTKPVEWLLTAILDPAQVVEDRYRGWTATLKSGDEPLGLIAAETSNNIVLRTAGGVDLPLLRDDLQSLDPLPGSLMPDGFEEALDPQAMADLLAWMSQSRSESE